MSINESICQQKLLVSKLSVISFVLAVFSYAVLISALIFKTSLKGLLAFTPLIMFFFLTISLVLSIMDLRRKNRKRIFSIIAIVLSSLYFLLIIGSIVVVLIIHK
ncbi:hypothetical protein [Clostridium gasigenes]|uniref:hypothetical protein n=1 Tax=Clostridium gasigenes TaxID=94869 RepID=UPI001C0B43BA|nr:hypothetical protein [Clostridium gasigenes]MBU3104302.1 hypothetical protein [Clostridium gasigenes]